MTTLDPIPAERLEELDQWALRHADEKGLFRDCVAISGPELRRLIAMARSAAPAVGVAEVAADLRSRADQCDELAPRAGMPSETYRLRGSAEAYRNSAQAVLRLIRGGEGG